MCDTTCMAKTEDKNNTAMTDKTMTPTVKSMGTTKMKKSETPPTTTTNGKVGTESNGMDATSASSTTSAAALHVVIGMVNIIAKHYS